MKKPLMLRSKKGILGVSLDSVGTWIQGIVSIMPAPVKFLIFMFVLVSLTYVLSIVFSSFGIYCNSANQPVKLDANVLTSISLINDIPKPEDLGKEAIQMEETGFTTISEQVSTCSRQMQSGTIYFNDSQRILITLLLPPPLYTANQIYVQATNPPTERLAMNFTTPIYFYDGTFCTDCQKALVCDSAGYCTKRCIGDVQRKNNIDKSLFQKAFCGSIGCEPPEHYRYDYQQNLYVCNDDSCQGITLGQKWDELLASKGAKLYYETQNNLKSPESTNMFGITCTALKPRLAIYGIDLFRYEIWVFLLLLIILWWAYKAI